MRNALRILFTGSSGGGKTELLARLHDLGFSTIPEHTEVLYQRLFSGNRIVGKTWREQNQDAFVSALFAIRRELDELQPTSMNHPILLFDRGAPDFIVYCKRRKLYLPLDMEQILKTTHYDMAFLFPVPTNFEYRPQKSEIERTAAESEMHVAALRAICDEMQIPVINVPLFESVEPRLEFVLRKIQRMFNI